MLEVVDFKSLCTLIEFDLVNITLSVINPKQFIGRYQLEVLPYLHLTANVLKSTRNDMVLSTNEFASGIHTCSDNFECNYSN